MLRLGLHHLAMIKSLHSTGSVSATAREMGLTQSAISHRMKEAERRVDTQIFHRDSHTIMLTQAGKRLLKSAEIILDEALAAERDLEHLSTGHKMVIRMGIACYAGLHWYPTMLKMLESQMPDCMLEISPNIHENPANLLHDKTADFILLAGTLEQPELKSIPLFGDELVVVLHPNHKLASQLFIEPEMFRDEVYATHHTLPEKGREYETLFKPHGLYPKEVICAGQTEAILELVSAHEAVSIFPKWAIEARAKKLGLALTPIKENGLPIQWYLLAKKISKNEALILQLAELFKALQSATHD